MFLRCRKRWDFHPKGLRQISHSKSLALSWTTFIWFTKMGFIANLLLQMWQGKLRSPSWTCLRCFSARGFDTNSFSQIPHWCSFIFSWTVLICLLSISFVECPFLQIGQKAWTVHEPFSSGNSEKFSHMINFLLYFHVCASYVLLILTLIVTCHKYYKNDV